MTANQPAGQNLDEWYGRTSGGTTLTYLPDALGSTLKLTDAAQAVTASYSYEPYGKTTVSGSTGGSSLAYTGRENDGTGLYYYRARYYHPGVGRFVAEDPIGLGGGPNLYSYVNGSPLSYTDPTGQFMWVPAAIGGAIGAVTGAAAYQQCQPVWMGALVGAAAGATAGFVLSAAPTVIVGAAAGAAGDIATSFYAGSTPTLSGTGTVVEYCNNRNDDWSHADV